jgi:3-oxoacyl-[acyl-carrier-protein] synthase II
MKNSRRVVITGLGVVAPNGIGKEPFWQNLIAGKSGVSFITAFDASSYPCQIAGQVSEFIASDFMRSRTAKTMGRFSQLGVAATRLALEDASLSISPELATQTVACFGNSANGIGDIAADAIEKLSSQGVSAVRPWSALEFPPHAATSHLAIEFGIRGQAVSISSNCCTGLDVIEIARNQIVNGTATVALAGSCDAPIFPSAFSAFCALGALTKRNDVPEKASRPYDLLRDGLVISEGAATLVLEEYEFALDRGATIYAEVLGFNAGSEAIGMRKGDLSGKVMADVIKGAISRSGLSPEDIDHINAHGSSLADYDICDSNAFKEGLGEHAYHIPITSIKSMIGQPISAAGTLQTAAACLSLRAQCAPPTINQEVRDPQCDLDYVPNVARIARIRHVLINAHSFGGSVSALVIARLTDKD